MARIPCGARSPSWIEPPGAAMTFIASATWQVVSVGPGSSMMPRSGDLSELM